GGQSADRPACGGFQDPCRDWRRGSPCSRCSCYLLLRVIDGKTRIVSLVSMAMSLPLGSLYFCRKAFWVTSGRSLNSTRIGEDLVMLCFCRQESGRSSDSTHIGGQTPDPSMFHFCCKASRVTLGRS